ncbi:hypothetical protein [Alienimonas sp. DA493]|uniref:hypothetical protein n=1 Tax=Alienimonas sp. DA493 TaxID=3373605 RepID=UPI003755356A
MSDPTSSNAPRHVTAGASSFVRVERAELDRLHAVEAAAKAALDESFKRLAGSASDMFTGAQQIAVQSALRDVLRGVLPDGNKAVPAPTVIEAKPKQRGRLA